MFIKGISFFNYKKFKEPTEISFEDFIGRIGILGNNGSGKSSLLDVIPIALYGVDAITGKKEHLRTQGVEKDAVKLRLEFEHTNKNFIIEREFRGANLTPKAAVYEVLDEVPHIIAQSAKETNEAIEKIIGMDYSTFVATVFCKQKELNRIASMLPTERKAFILKLSKVDEIDDEIKKCRELKRDSDKLVNFLMQDISNKEKVLEEIKTLDEDIKTMKAEHKGALSKLDKYELKLKESESNKKEYDEKYEKYNELTLELKDCKNSMDNISRDIERYTNEEQELVRLDKYIKEEGNVLIEKQKEIQDKVEALDLIRPKYMEKLNLISNINKVKKEGSDSKALAENIQKKASSLGYKKEGMDSLEKSIIDIENTIDKIKSMKLEKEGLVKSIIIKANECKGEIKKIQDLFEKNKTDAEDCKCPMCKQSVSKEYTDIVKKHYKEQLDTLTKEYNEVSTEVKALTEDLNKNIESLNKNKAELKNLKDLEKAYNELVAEYNAMKNQYLQKVEEYKALNEKYKLLEDIQFDESTYNALKEDKKAYDLKTKDVYIAIDKVSKLPGIKERLVALNSEKTNIVEKYNKIVAEGKALNFNREEYIKVKSAYEKAYNAFNGVKEETSMLVNQINAKDVTERKFLKDKLENIKEKEKEYNKNKDLSRDFTVIEEVLLKTKSEIMTKINPLINKHFSDIFKTLLNEKYDDVELDDNYNIVIYDCGEAFPLSRFSGGEQDLCNLSLRLAVSKFLTEATSGNIDFIVLDEIFASLDDDKKSALIEVLGNLKDFFKQIFIISHEDVIKSSLDHYLTVKENEYRYSEIEY